MVLSALVLLVGCTSWIDQKPACGFDVYDWSNDLTAHILTGPGDGTFDYDPDDVPRQNIRGTYHLMTGDFDYEVTYADSYWLESESVTGFGTAWHNGDLDIEYTSHYLDVLGAEWDVNRRVVREGCSMSVATWTKDNESDWFQMDGEYQDDSSYAWAAEDNATDYKGGMRKNLSTTFGYTAKDGSWDSASTTKPEGTTETTYTGECYTDGYTCEGSSLTRFDGGREATVHVLDANGDVYLTATSDYAYDGSGTEHQDFADGGTCDFTTDAEGSCDYTCSDGQSGRC